MFAGKLCACYNRMVCDEFRQKMVGKLEVELEDYENISGRHFSAEKPTTFEVREV